MKSSNAILGNEDGAILIVFAVLFLAILSILGISATNTAVVEQKVATNDQIHKTCFSASESGVYVMSKLISSCINDNISPVGAASVTSSSAPNSYNNTLLSFTNLNDFFDMMMGYNTAITDATLKVDDISQAELNIRRLGQSSNVAGGGAEFATGSAGAGTGSVAGVQIYYNLESEGNIPARMNTQMILEANYRKVIGVAGGL